MKSTSVAILSTLITYAIVLGGYAFWLISSYNSSEYMLDATNSMLYIPNSLWPLIIEGGPKGLVVTMLLVTAHTLVYTSFTIIAGTLAGLFLFPARQRKPKKPKPTIDRLRHDDSDYPITVIAPTSIDPVTRDVRPGGKMHALFDDTQIRLKRANIQSRRPPKTSIEHLELALLQTLYAHREWTSDPAGHHSDVGIYEHSLGVVRRLRESCNHPLARVVGLAHDIGKLLAYEKKDGQWIHRSKNHDRLSGEILRHMPEFQQLQENDRRTLSRVLSYAHSRKLPRTLSKEARELIQALKVADGLTTSDDRKTSETALNNESVMNTVKRVVEGLIPELNINNYAGREHTDGWTIEGVEFVAVLESKLREAIAGHLPHNIAQSLQAFVTVDSTSYHPMTKAIVTSIEELGLLIHEVGTGENAIQAHEGLFDIKAGRQKFVDVILLDKDKLSTDKRVNINRWGSAGYRLRIRESRRVKREREEMESVD